MRRIEGCRKEVGFGCSGDGAESTGMDRIGKGEVAWMQKSREKNRKD